MLPVGVINSIVALSVSEICFIGQSNIVSTFRSSFSPSRFNNHPFYEARFIIHDLSKLSRANSIVIVAQSLKTLIGGRRPLGTLVQVCVLGFVIATFCEAEIPKQNFKQCCIRIW